MCRWYGESEHSTKNLNLLNGKQWAIKGIISLFLIKGYLEQVEKCSVDSSETVYALTILPENNLSKSLVVIWYLERNRSR